MKLEMEDRILAWCKNHGFQVVHNREANRWLFNNPNLGLQISWQYQLQSDENAPRERELITFLNAEGHKEQFWSCLNSKHMFEPAGAAENAIYGSTTVEELLSRSTRMCEYRLRFLNKRGHRLYLYQDPNQSKLTYCILNIFDLEIPFAQALITKSPFPALNDTATLDMWRSWLCGAISVEMFFEFIFEKHPFLAKYA